MYRRTAALLAGAAARLLGAAALLLGSAQANAAEFQEGVHYIELPVPVETQDPAKIEVVEVFSYGCIHCYQLEPALSQWLQTVEDDVDFRRLPLVTQYLLPFANAFYTAETLGVLERVHLPIFAAIHEYQIDMSRPEHVRRLFAREAEVNEEEFLKVYESFGVRSRIRQAEAQGRMYRIRATPSMVVNGRYVTEAGQAGSTQGMLLLVNHLIEKERQAAR